MVQHERDNLIGSRHLSPGARGEVRLGALASGWPGIGITYLDPAHTCFSVDPCGGRRSVTARPWDKFVSSDWACGTEAGLA